MAEHRIAGVAMYKVWCVIVGVAMFLPLWMLAQPSPYSGAGKLAALKGNSRPLLIFYPQTAGVRPLGALLESQQSMIKAHQAELMERSVVPMYIPREEWVEDAPIGARRDLRNQFHINDKQFTVVLLGKDGGEKFRSHEPVTIEKLDALIDAMLMRQQEVLDGKHAK